MKADITVRPLLFSEAAAAAELERCVFSDPWSESDLAAMTKSADHVVLCAVSEESDLLGYLAASSICGECELLRIATSPEMRRRGIGGLLLDHLIYDRKSVGDTTVFLEVRASNLPAISLYRSRAFDEYASRRNYYKNPTEDALMMRLDLDK